MTLLRKLTVKGFKSIRELVDFELTNLNVFIGANGSGKSNLISFFKLVQKIAENNANSYIQQHGGINDFLFNGRKVTERINVRIGFENHQYSFGIIEVTSPDGSCMVDDEEVTGKQVFPVADPDDQAVILAKDSFDFIYKSIQSWQIYHFNDTTKTAGIRNLEIIQDDKRLRGDAANLAPFLLKLKNSWPDKYLEIVNVIRLVMPYFSDFNLEVRKFGEAEKVNLSWFQKGSDYPFQPYHLSDGSIRLIALATALLQPEPPSLVIIDEPELGLHPEAIHILAELIKDAAQRTQVIVATQSPALLDNFAVEDIVVVNRENGASNFRRLSEEDFKVWLEDYSVGELWTKNVIAGGPVSE
ncbi:MAG: AAA family ATPase [Candidatus Riflebacteria bacterium]|nr:AAA family ATPase [Candidatus Riflebacteria bacterium]